MVVCILLDLHALGVLPPGLQKEVLDLLDLAGHLETRDLKRQKTIIEYIAEVWNGLKQGSFSPPSECQSLDDGQTIEVL